MTGPIYPIPARVWNDPPLPRRRELLWLAAGKVCRWCGVATQLSPQPGWDQATIEHIIAKADGGSDAPDNLTSACRRCNERRGYERSVGLPYESLLGKYPLKKNTVGRDEQGRVVLSGDEKQVIIGTKPKIDMANVYRSERDRVLQELMKVRDEKRAVEVALEKRGLYIKSLMDQISTLQLEMKSITIWNLIRKRLSDWLKP